MRILFVSSPGLGHLQPMLGLATAARGQGHAVAWATAPDAAALLRPHGIEVLAAGVPFGASIAEYRRRWPEVAAIPPRQQAAHAFPRLFGEVVASAMLPALQRAVADWKPTLLIGEPAALAAPLAAVVAGVACITHGFGLPMPRGLLTDAAAAMAPAWRHAGLPVPAHAGLYAGAAIEIAPPTLLAANPDSPRAPRVLWQRPSAVTGAPDARLPASLEAFLGAARGRDVVYATFGTVHPGGPAFAALVRSLAGLETPVVVTTGPQAEWPTGVERGANIWVGPYVPQELVLPRCSAVISHAGSGTALAALAQGLPQLCLPQGADQFRNADALRAVGAALMLEGESPAVGLAPETIASAVRLLLGDDAVRHAARALRGEIEAMPAPDDVVVELASRA